MIEVKKVKLENGNFQYDYWDSDYDYPLGNIWIRLGLGHKGSIIAFILNMQTTVGFRKKGICTSIHHYLLKDCDCIICIDGSKEGGESFLKSFGYIYNDTLDIWYYKKGN
jgi:hypothetical protein